MILLYLDPDRTDMGETSDCVEDDTGESAVDSDEAEYEFSDPSETGQHSGKGSAFLSSLLSR